MKFWCFFDGISGFQCFRVVSSTKFAIFCPVMYVTHNIYKKTNELICPGKGPGSGLFPAGEVDLVGSLSPLQRMASITNSLVSQPSLPGQPQVNRPSRASLPPITQQQFDRFSHLNTDEVVRRVSYPRYLGGGTYTVVGFPLWLTNFCKIPQKTTQHRQNIL